MSSNGWKCSASKRARCSRSTRRTAVSSYRESVFKHTLRGRVVITAVELRLSRTPQPRLDYGDVAREVEARGGVSLRNIREAISAIRRAKLPDPKVAGNAGNFFKNPVVGASEAARLLATWPDMPHYPAPDGGVKAGRRMAHRPRRVERPQRRARRRARAAGAGAREPRRRDGRRSDRLRPADPAVGRRTVRRGDLDRSQYPLNTPAAAGPASPERERNENMSER